MLTRVDSYETEPVAPLAPSTPKKTSFFEYMRKIAEIKEKHERESLSPGTDLMRQPKKPSLQFKLLEPIKEAGGQED